MGCGRRRDRKLCNNNYGANWISGWLHRMWLIVSSSCLLPILRLVLLDTYMASNSQQFVTLLGTLCSCLAHYALVCTYLCWRAHQSFVFQYNYEIWVASVSLGPPKIVGSLHGLGFVCEDLISASLFSVCKNLKHNYALCSMHAQKRNY